MNDDLGSRPSDTGAGPDTSGYLEYLRANRDFTAPAVAAAVSSLRSAPSTRPLRVLDAGTGAGGALPGLAELADSVDGGTVLAIDVDADAIATARDQIASADLGRELVEFQVADLRDVAAAGADAGQGFDVIWSSDVVWPATFEDPADVVRSLADALNPGGTLALYTSNYYQSMFLPGHSRLERLIRTASELTWGLPDDGPTQYERLGAWMRQAGLEVVEPRVFPIVAMASEPVARAFLELIVWPEMRHAVASRGRAAGMSEEDIGRAEELLDPGSAAWIGADPDAFVVQPTLLWVGRAPLSGRSTNA